MPYPFSEKEIAGRACGGCTMCCRTHGVRELDKMAHEICRNAECNGCAIYAGRPKTCQEYRCLWLLGAIAGDERRRPDNLGLVADLLEWEDKMRPHAPAIIGLYLWETRKGSADTQAAQWFISRAAQNYPVVLRRWREPGKLPEWKVMGPPRKIATVKQSIREGIEKASNEEIAHERARQSAEAPPSPPGGE